MPRDIVEKLEFGCPFKPWTTDEKAAEMAEVVMQEGAEEIKKLRAEVSRLEECLKSADGGWFMWQEKHGEELLHREAAEAERDRYKAAYEYLMDRNILTSAVKGEARTLVEGVK